MQPERIAHKNHSSVLTRPPGYLLRDRDGIFGDDFTRQVREPEIREVHSAPRSPWQRACVERVIGTIRRECIDRLIAFGESSLRRNLRSYFDYYHDSGTHLSLSKGAPHPRPVQPAKPGQVIAIPQVGGLHHRYERRAAGTWQTQGALRSATDQFGRDSRSLEAGASPATGAAADSLQ